MIDSCNPSKLEPGFAATYSNPSVLITSTMKSDAGCSTRRADARVGGGVVSAASWALPGAAGAERLDAGSWFSTEATGAAFATRPAAPTAAPFRNRRRPTDGRWLTAMTLVLRVLRPWREYTRPGILSMRAARDYVMMSRTTVPPSGPVKR